MLKEKDMIKVHLYDTSNREIKTRNYNRVLRFVTKTENLALIGIPKEVRVFAEVKYSHLLRHLLRL